MKKFIAFGFMFVALAGLVHTAQAKGDDLLFAYRSAIGM